MRAFILLLVLLGSFSTQASTLTKTYSVEKVFEIKGVVWGFDFIDDTSIIYTLRDGSMALFDLTTQKHQSIQGVPKVYARGQGGLLDVRKSPTFDQTPWIYFTYSAKGKHPETNLARAKLEKHQLKNIEVLFTSNSESDKSIHFGSRITFDDNGHVFFSVGDRGNRDDAQDLGKANGKIMRLLLDGSTPSDNPFINQKGSLSTIWSYGHRNPQGLFYDLGSKKLYSNEHGPKGGDEINLIEKGKNYGWPVITFGREYYGPKVGKGLTKSAGMEQPLYYFTPSIAPSSLSIYKGNQFPEFQGAFLAGALVLQHINIAQENDSKWKETRILLELSERIRNVLVRDGDIYFSTDSGKLMKIIN